MTLNTGRVFHLLLGDTRRGHVHTLITFDLFLEPQPKTICKVGKNEGESGYLLQSISCIHQNMFKDDLWPGLCQVVENLKEIFHIWTDHDLYWTLTFNPCTCLHPLTTKTFIQIPKRRSISSEFMFWAYIIFHLTSVWMLVESQDSSNNLESQLI